MLPIIGLKESATKLDITTAEAKVIAVWVNKTPVIPLINTSGTNTATSTTVVAIIAKENSVNSFFYVSSIGAHPKASSGYLKNKGQVEEELKNLNFSKLVIFHS